MLLYNLPQAGVRSGDCEGRSTWFMLLSQRSTCFLYVPWLFYSGSSFHSPPVCTLHVMWSYSDTGWIPGWRMFDFTCQWKAFSPLMWSRLGSKGRIWSSSVLMIQSQQHGADVANCEMFLLLDVFSLTWPKLEPHFATGSNKQGLCCGDVAGARTKGGSNKFQLLQPTGVFPLLNSEFVILLLGMFWPKYFSLLQFKLLAGFSYTSQTSQLWSHWVSCADSSFTCLFNLFHAFCSFWTISTVVLFELC